MEEERQELMEGAPKRRLRILLSAFFCSPYRGSESAVGWNVASRLAETHDVTLLCGDLKGQQLTRRELTRWKEEVGFPDGLRIVHVAPTPLVRAWNRAHQIPGLWFIYYEAYRQWQELAYNKAFELHAEKPFDLVHQLTVIGYREPGRLWQLGIPFFWGPLAGAASVPAPYLSNFGFSERLRWTLRESLNRRQRTGSARCRAAAANAATIWTVSREDQEMIGSWGCSATPLLETGAKLPAENTETLVLPIDSPIRLVWSGLFQGIKALPLLLKALADMPEKDRFRLDVLGKGPEESTWRAEVDTLRISDIVHFHGFLTHENALAIMQQANILVHTSVKEGTPHVVLEALAMGLPVICHDACGMGIAVTDSCGIKIPLINPSASVSGFRDALQKLLDNPVLYHSLSQGAISRARNLSWDGLIATFLEAYQRFLKSPTS